jgi:hypothetical protein
MMMGRVARDPRSHSLASEPPAAILESAVEFLIASSYLTGGGTDEQSMPVTACLRPSR